jgi:hypothetical protein
MKENHAAERNRAQRWKAIRRNIMAGLSEQATADKLGLHLHTVQEAIRGMGLREDRDPCSVGLADRARRDRLPDTRDLTGILLGDPHPAVSALAQRSAER